MHWFPLEHRFIYPIIIDVKPGNKYIPSTNRLRILYLLEVEAIELFVPRKVNVAMLFQVIIQHVRKPPANGAVLGIHDAELIRLQVK